VLESVRVLCLWALSTNLRDRNPEIRVAGRTFGGLNRPTGVRNIQSCELCKIKYSIEWNTKRA